MLPPVQGVLQFLSLHPLLAIFFVVLAKQAGAPLPAMPLLLLAGASAARDAAFGAQGLLVAVIASTLGDLAWFAAGKLVGRRVIALLCRISVTPDTCVRRNELAFSRRGPLVLVFAKFLPGLDTLAPAMAGSIGMGAQRFLVFDIAGASLWAGSGMAVGLLLHQEIQGLAARASYLGARAAWALVGLLVAYVGWRFWRRWRDSVCHAVLPRSHPASWRP